jgi:probable rRNA maturation factor
MSGPASTVLFRRIRRRMNRARVRQLARRLEREVAGGRAFTCLLAGDVELRRLNRAFLNRDCPTDVLSFPASGVSLQACGRLSSRPPGRPEGRPQAGKPAPPLRSLGDIAISVGRAAAQARRHGHSLEDEIGILMLHGLLHLVGYDHERDRGRMARAEARWRRALGLPAGLTERASP